MLGLVLAVAADEHDRPAAVWVLVFLAVVLLTTGSVCWAYASSEAERQQREDRTSRDQPAVGPTDRTEE